MKGIFDTTKDDVQTTAAITKKSYQTNEEYLDSKELHTKKITKTTGNFFDSTDNYKKVPTTKLDTAAEDDLKPTEKLVTEDYPDVTKTPKEIVSTIVDYPEDVTNYRIMPTEINIETTTVKDKPWMHTTSSVQSKRWWITSILKTRRPRRTRFCGRCNKD